MKMRDIRHIINDNGEPYGITFNKSWYALLEDSMKRRRVGPKVTNLMRLNQLDTLLQQRQTKTART